MKKYSQNFERDYNWYLNHRHQFSFSGSIPPTITTDLVNGKSAKECFFIYDSHGKKEFAKISTREPELLAEIILCKESVNFQIKEWAQGRADGTLPKIDFSIAGIETSVKWGLQMNDVDFAISTSIRKTIEEEFELLPWMVQAVENQKYKYYN